ncbi:MAG: hypothetical protein L6Q92_03030 [Phycisphaerae bacterium]|nr:hypothetical protein [Phycisphaerae bacterium]
MLWGLAMLAVIVTGCTTDLFLALLGFNQPPPGTFGISFASPATTQNASPGAPAVIRWADITDEPGTSVQLAIRRVDPDTRDVLSETILIPSRDALADGASDRFDWDVSGVIVGSYQPVLRMSSPTGQSAEEFAPGDFNVISAFASPTLTFTTPGAADVSVMTGNNTTIQWTDNGVVNGLTTIRLVLDTDANDHENGNEITIAEGIMASDDGNNGDFMFDTNDVNMNPVPTGTYTLFAVLEDGIHDDGLGNPILVEAVGRIIITP